MKLLAGGITTSSEAVPPEKCLGFGVEDLGFRVEDLGFRI